MNISQSLVLAVKSQRLNNIRLITILLLLLGCIYLAASNQDNFSQAHPPMLTASSTKNVLGTTLQICGKDPVTGFYRDGCCHTGPSDHGRHVICARMTEEFLSFTASCGNDLVTPKPQYRFPGLKAGDQWCLCAIRWRDA